MSNEHQDIAGTEKQADRKVSDDADRGLACDMWEALANSRGCAAVSSRERLAPSAESAVIAFDTGNLYGDASQAPRRGSEGSVNASDQRRIGQTGADGAGADKASDRAERSALQAKSGDQQLREEWVKINDLAKTRITNPEELARFRNDMVQFEVRAAQSGLGAEEIARTYREVSRLLESERERPTSAQDRVKLAEQVMHQAAHPGSVNQGFHSTCNVAVLESRIYNRNPSEAARLVADVAVNGLYETAGGKVVHPNEQGLKPDWEAKNNPPGDGERSHASQIFQKTAVDMYWQKENARSNPPGQIRYEQRPDKADGDTGERLLDYSKNPPAEIARAPRVRLSGLGDISEQITGKNETDLMIVTANYPDRQDWVKVQSQEDFRQKLAEMKREGRLPVVLPIFSSHEPFLGDGSKFAGGGTGGEHVVTITDFDERTGQVKVDNQLGQSSDRALPADKVFRAMSPPEARENIEALRRDLAAHPNDTFTQLDVARLEHEAGKKGDPAFADKQGGPHFDMELVRLMGEAKNRWRQEKESGTFDPAEEKRATEKFNSIMSTLSKPRRLIVRSMLSDQR